MNTESASALQTSVIIHFLAATVIGFGAVMLLYQLITYMTRPSDRNRLWYLILLLLIIGYNFANGLLPNASLPIGTFSQYIFAYLTSIALGLFLPFYIYQYTKLESFRFYAYYGSLLFVFIPFLLLFLIPYALTQNEPLSGKIFIVIPTFYGVSMFYTLIRGMIHCLKNNSEQIAKLKIVGITISFLFWFIGLSIIFFFTGDPFKELVVTNTGFLLISIINVYTSIKEARIEHKKLMHSEEALKKMNELLQQKVNERTKELEIAIEQRTNAFISLAHETRTPLTLIICYLDDYVSKHGETEEIRIIQTNLKKLNNDITLFFEEERLKKGIKPIFKHDKTINLSEFVNEKVISFSSYFKKKKINILSLIEPNIFMKADTDALQCICNNLIENAIKFTPSQGTIHIELFMDQDKIKLKVQDTGCGIPAEKISNIFKPYFQLHENKEGMGMGLSIVNNCLQSLGGSIDVKSDGITGSEFLVTLQPLQQLDVPSSEILSDESEIQVEDALFNADKPSIFLVEDNLQLINYLRNKLKERYNVYVAVNGSLALIKLKLIPPPQLIISDVMMDELDGIQFYKTLLEIPTLKHIPVIFLTARISQEKKFQALSMGAMDYITKPFSIHELIYKIDAHLAIIQKQKEAFLNSAIQLMNIQIPPIPEKHQDSLLKFHDNCRIYNITSREKDIIQLISEGLSYKEIGVKLNISEKTIIKHKQNIFGKTRVSNKVELLNKIMM